MIDWFWIWLSFGLFGFIGLVGVIGLSPLMRFHDGHEYLEIVDRIYRHRFEQLLGEYKGIPHA